MTIQKRTIRRLRAAASKLFPDDEYYYQFIGQQFGVDSTLDLTESQGEEALSIIDRELKARKQQDHGSRKPGMITPNQREYIEGLFKTLGWVEYPRQIGWFKKITGKQCSINMLTNREASKVITGLERMVAENEEKAEAN